MSSILLLVHMLPPTSKGQKKSVKISISQAVKHLVRYLQVSIFFNTPEYCILKISFEPQ